MILSLQNIIKKKTIGLIKDIGNGLNEIVFDIKTSEDIFNSIEYINRSILLHKFKEDFDLIFDYDNLSEQDKFSILGELKKFKKNYC